MVQVVVAVAAAAAAAAAFPDRQLDWKEHRVFQSLHVEKGVERLYSSEAGLHCDERQRHLAIL
jgi:hypothetical protein